MEAIKGYKVGATLFEGRDCRVVRAYNLDSGHRHVLKLLKEQFPPPDIQSQFRYEYELTRRVGQSTEGVIGVGELKRHGHGLLMELEDIGALSLEAAIATEGPCLGDLRLALDIAIQLAEIVGRIHRALVTHKGLNPANILYNLDDGAIRIIDFGIASELTHESAQSAGVDLPFSALHYISPEQTGRMNRSVDHRADLYGLGATLFHLFAGRAPFEDAEKPLDAIGLIHAQIAKPPPGIAEINSDVPAMVNAIVARLLEKDVADRYQSALGVQTDLERCRTELLEIGKIEPFVLGDSDQFDRLSQAQRLYGRDLETKDLLDCFERVRTGASEFVFVHGYSGIGKSALVNELQRSIALSNGVFISGKFDLNLRDQPYGSFLQALQELVRHRLAENADDIERLAGEIRTALGPNGQVIIDVVPEVELIIGPQPAVPDLGPQETQNRFGRVFEEFLKVFARAEHPLVIFIDDLQWADSPSLNLIRRIAGSGSLGHLLVIGAYRDNEIDAAHPLTLLLESLEAIDFPVTYIELGALSETDVGGLINDILRQTTSDAGDLVQLCYQKTSGNPFFLNQFLTSLNQDGLLTFDQAAAAWQWRLSEIEERNYTDNVVDLVVERIRRLPTEAETALKIAACIGSRFDLFGLAQLLGKPSAEVAQEIWPLLRENLLLPLSDFYRAAREHGADDNAEAGANVTYRFLHDRVQQAAYALLSDAERQKTHLIIGRSLQSSIDEDTAREQWFNLLMHLNSAGDLIETPAERRELAALNLAAGKRAKLAAAFESAVEYLGAGLAGLPQGSWETDYELALDLYVEAAEAAYLNHDFEHMALLGAEVATHATSLMDKMRMHEIELRSLIAQDRRLDAIATALPLLGEIGAAIPGTPAPEDYGAAFGGAEGALAGRDMAEIADLPEMTDPHACAAMRILSLIFSAAYFSAPQLLPLIIAKLVELSARHGNIGESAFGYAVYGLHLCAFAGDIERGYDFGRLSREVLDRTDARPLRARTLFIANICVVHWKEPIRATLEPLLNAYQAGLDNGDIEYSTHALMIHNQHLFAVGHNLAQLHERMAGQKAAIIASKEEAALTLFQIYHQSVANWLGQAEDPVRLIGAHYDETAMRPVHEQVGDRTALFHLSYNKTVLAYGFGDIAAASAAAVDARSFLDGAVGVHQIPLFHFYESLVLLADADAPDCEARIAENQSMLRGWADHCPENNLHRWHLVEAERFARFGDPLAALDHFEKAAEGAQENEFLQEEGLAHERHALFWLGRGNRAIAQSLMGQAESCYRLWGAQAKLDFLNTCHGDLMADRAKGHPGASTDGSVVSTIDIETVLKAAEALSGATALEDLMTRMMHIIMQNAGAGRGTLILHKRGRNVAAADADAGSDTVRMLVDLSVEDLDDADPETPLCAAVIRYVLRSEGTVVLDNAQVNGGFESNAYIQRHSKKSLLCMPLTNQGKLSALLYLENDLAEGAFTPERLELLKHLSGQMAVQIENAQFYDEVMHLNRAYERFVPRQFLSYLGRESIVDVELGDQVSQDMTVMFLDIRDFARLSEPMTPEETFSFINLFLEVVEPQVGRHSGFVDKYTGDGLMALFPGSADDAVRCSLDIQAAVGKFNLKRADQGEVPISMGIGLHTGRLMLGTIGGLNRMDGTVISAAVNMAGRIEQLNKTYGTSLLISKETLSRLDDPEKYQIRELGRVRAKGGLEVSLHEVFDGDPPARSQLKSRTRTHLAKALAAFERNDRDDAQRALSDILSIDPEDEVAKVYLKKLN